MKKLIPLYSAKRKPLFAEVPQSGALGLKEIRLEGNELGFTWYLKPGEKVNLFDLSQHKTLVSSPAELPVHDSINPNEVYLDKLLIRVGASRQSAQYFEMPFPQQVKFEPSKTGDALHLVGIEMTSNLAGSDMKPMVHYQIGATLDLVTGDLHLILKQNMADGAERDYGKVEIVGYSILAETLDLNHL